MSPRFVYKSFVSEIYTNKINAKGKIFKQKIKSFIMKIGRKISGGRYIRQRKKKSSEAAGQKRIVKLGEEKQRSKRTRGGNEKIFLLGTKFVNVHKKGEDKKLEIKKVLETPSNRFLARQNIITKGTIVETSDGKVRITNRPSQEGVINGIFVE